MAKTNLVNENGYKVARMYVIETLYGSFFEAYGAIIAHIDRAGLVSLVPTWDYMKFADKYADLFCMQRVGDTATNLLAAGKAKIVGGIVLR